MCMTAGSSVKGAGSFVATDTRRQRADMSRHDPGEKIVWTGSGWVTGLGSSYALDVALEAAKGAGGVANLSERRAQIATALAEEGYAPRREVHDGSFLCLLLLEASNPDRIAVTNAGDSYEELEDDHTVGLPRGLDDDWYASRRSRAFGDMRAAGSDLARRIRSTARHFHEAAAVSDRMSDVMEIGYIFPTPDGPACGFLRGNAGEIASSDARDILTRFAATPYDDGNYSTSATTSDGLSSHSGVKESGGKPINRLYGKALAADADDFGSIVDALAWKKVVSVSAGGQVQAASIASLAVTDAKINDAAAGKLTAGTLVSGVNESGGKAVNRLLGKALAGDGDTLGSVVDDAVGGYRKPAGVNASNKITTSSIAAAAVTPTESQARNRCKVFKGSGTTAIGSGVGLTAVAFDSEEYDVGTLHDTATNNSHITIPSGGDTGPWVFIATVLWAANATGRRLVGVYKNGASTALNVNICAPTPGTGNTTQQSVVAMDSNPTAGDYYEVKVEQNSGGSLNIIGNTIADSTSFMATHLW